MKMTSKKDENLVQVQQQCSVYFCIEIFFESWFFWLIQSFKCLILVILTMTVYHETLLRDGPSSLLSMVNFFSSLEPKMILKIPNKTFLRITRYLYNTVMIMWQLLPKMEFRCRQRKTERWRLEKVWLGEVENNRVRIGFLIRERKRLRTVLNVVSKTRSKWSWQMYEP